MASESREETAVDGVDVPAGLDDWLDERAASLGIDRTELVVQVLASYRAAATMDGDLDAAQLLDLDADDFVDVETAVEDALDRQVSDAAETAVRERMDARIDDRIEARVDERVAERVDGLLDDRVDGLVETHVERALDEELSGRIDDLDAEFQEKITDVRERVVQVKREVDGKAPETHTHDELAAVDVIDARVDELATAVTELREDLSDRIDDVEAGLDGREDETAALAERVDDAAEKLNRVAWVVSDLKEETTGRDAHEQAVDRIRRAAAQEGVSTAACERCGETVHVALLNDPECPHCRATVSDVRPGGGFLRKNARLVAASQLESGDGTDP